MIYIWYLTVDLLILIKRSITWAIGTVLEGKTLSEVSISFTGNTLIIFMSTACLTSGMAYYDA
jgi:hypothetical protein